HPDTIESLQHLGFILRMAGRPDEALALFRQTYDAQARLWGPEDPRTLTSLQGLAFAQWSVGRREEAIDLGRRVLALRLRGPGPRSSARALGGPGPGHTAPGDGPFRGGGQGQRADGGAERAGVRPLHLEHRLRAQLMVPDLERLRPVGRHPCDHGAPAHETRS